MPSFQSTRAWRIARAAWPWLSLCAGVANALLMDRRPERAGLVCATILLGWLGLVGVGIAGRSKRAAAKSRATRWARAASMFAAAMPIQLATFFTFPLYWQAYTGSIGQTAFMGLLTLTALITLWEPLQGSLLARPLWGAGAAGVASFAGLNALLPVLGLSNRVSLMCAGLAVAVMVPLVLWTHRPRNAPRGWLWRRALVFWLAPASLLLPVARGVVPAAPLRLMQAQMGTRVVEHALVDPVGELAAPPAQLVCFSQLWAPRGLRDSVVHVWRKNGHVIDRIPVTVWGTSTGFRTWSIKQNLGDDGRGAWTCSIETGAGQFLGKTALHIGGARADARQ